MADKQIHELTAISRSPESEDMLAVDTGSMTGKMNYSTFKNAVNADAMAAVNNLSAAVVHVDAEQVLTDAQKATARENIGAADDDDLTALENTVNVELAGKVDVAQGASNSGKALVVGANGNVTIGGSVRYDASQGLTSAQKEVARENIGAVDDNDLAELENTVNVELAGKADAATTEGALAGKVNVAQGAAQAGKALVVGDDGNVTTGDAGIPEAVKTALLNLLEHVAYADGQGQSLYEALVEAFGEDFYDTWVWKLSDEQFEVGVNSVGYDDATHSIFIGNSASVAAIRRHIQVGKGRKPFTNGIGGDDTIYYPIPIPPRASRAKVTITPSIQFSANICKLSGDIWTRSLDTGWKTQPGVFNFDAGENQALIINMRADANNSAFTNATEPTEIVIEFAIEDYYDSWHWEMADGHITVNQRGVGLDTTTHRLFITASNANIRRFVAVNRGIVPYYDAGSGSESAFYPIPVPPTAQKVTVNVTPSTIQGQACVMKREGEAYSSHKWMEWSNFPLVSTFTPSENLDLMIQLRANSSNSDFTTSTEPTALTVDFE